MAKKEKLKKGEYGYINYKRRTQPLFVLLYVLIGIAIFILGLALNRWEKTNIFTIFAFLMVIPAAKRLVNFIVFAPFHTIPKELKDKVEQLKKEGDVIYYDAVFTSQERVMFLSVLAVTGNEVLGLPGRKKEDREYIEKYLREAVKKRGWSYKVMLVPDEKTLFKKLETADRSLVREDQQELLDFLKAGLVE